jgi:hypothetical protein
MNIHKLIFFFVLLVTLGACASEPERHDPPEGYFATYIDEDGTKKFQYTMEFSGAGRAGGNRPPGNVRGHASGSSGRGVSGGVSTSTGGRSPRGSSGSGYEQFQSLNKQLENRLELELKDSGFCHTGHRETERLVEPANIFIRGECKEKASGADRNNFPNNLE